MFASGKKFVATGANLSSAGAFEVYLWVAGTLLVENEFLSGEEDLVGGLDDDDDSTMTGNSVTRGLKL